MTVETRPIEVEPRTKTVPEVLRHAALVLEEVGWSDGEPLCKDGRRCAGGAISFVVNGTVFDPGDPLTNAAATAFVRSTGQEPTFPMGAVAVWNDTPGRTAAEVIAALRAAADEADR